MHFILKVCSLVFLLKLVESSTSCLPKECLKEKKTVENSGFVFQLLPPTLVVFAKYSLVYMDLHMYM